MVDREKLMQYGLRIEFTWRKAIILEITHLIAIISTVIFTIFQVIVQHFVLRFEKVESDERREKIQSQVSYCFTNR